MTTQQRGKPKGPAAAGKRDMLMRALEWWSVALSVVAVVIFVAGPFSSKTFIVHPGATAKWVTAILLLFGALAVLTAFTLLMVVINETYHSRWRPSLLLGAAVGSSLLAAVSLYAIPSRSDRTLSVTTFSVVAGLSAASLLALAGWRLRQHRLLKPLAVATVVTVVVEAVLFLGLYAFAGAKVSSRRAAVRNVYTLFGKTWDDFTRVRKPSPTKPSSTTTAPAQVSTYVVAPGTQVRLAVGNGYSSYIWSQAFSVTNNSQLFGSFQYLESIGGISGNEPPLQALVMDSNNYALFSADQSYSYEAGCITGFVKAGQTASILQGSCNLVRGNWYVIVHALFGGPWDLIGTWSTGVKLLSTPS